MAVGQDGDPLGRITLGLLVSIGSTSGTAGVVVTTEAEVPGTLRSSLPPLSGDTPIGLPVESCLFLSILWQRIVLWMPVPLLYLPL